ncbi:carbamoyltransferase HypF [Micromonospora globispora]|uniref:Carbamoyltransferase n=1 Tax=Micromonospora globispora TaxID=1450148 RepID=A0A317K872_9ACTN|nr:carbamoyltransferase HypF [Micromonospora globispora]PWU47353.1 carbamoyltransferase HypF [Micromonospora globispora]PWU59426.1 carbamoyltransferase HypF [Micromonospora globispora]RQX00736.1 carbamoyltransferase HypF [Micromonospora globispora]
MDLTSVRRVHIRVEGIVQGVGFRPFVHALATEYDLAGFVGNDTAGVFVEAEGDGDRLAAFVADLSQRAPTLAQIERLTTEGMPPTGRPGFVIATSVTGASREALISPDTATCSDCLAELSDPTDRRHGYPFTNCTNCGPRFTIVKDVPYDRRTTTMAEFPLCAECAAEYADPANRRFHAEPVCCPACGPALRLVNGDGATVPGDPLDAAVGWLRDGRIVAVKGLGGYHLATRADDDQAVSTLRARKHREEKPFALMAADLRAARTLVDVAPAAEPVLTGARRPVVLLPRRADAPVARSVAPGNRDLGVMLPYTPLHQLLLARLGMPIVLTSGNVSDEPIAHRDDDAHRRLARIADGFLTHDRRIHVRTDDSVVRVFRGRELPVRRSRGYVPAPVTLPWRFDRPVLACGAELKNTFCVAKGRRAFVSHHIGDLENYETLRAFTDGIAHFTRLFDVRPEVVAHDLHPEYLSTKYALQREDVELVGVQHHHAHIASCLADNGHPGPVIGVAFDGLGYGPDGTLWGGELLVADLTGFERVGHLGAVPMPGGVAAVHEPWRMAAAYLDEIYGEAVPDLAVVRRHGRHWPAVVGLARTGTNSPRTSSVGRLFDAVAAIVGLHDRVSYEGQAAIALEQRADPDERGGYRIEAAGPVPLLDVGRGLVRCVVEDLLASVDPSRIAARFHHGLADAVVRAAGAVRESTGLATVALSGGVFQNVLLLDRVVSGLAQEGYRVLVHSRVPPNDGGISLGQAVVAAARGVPAA